MRLSSIWDGRGLNNKKLGIFNKGRKRKAFSVGEKAKIAVIHQLVDE